MHVALEALVELAKGGLVVGDLLLAAVCHRAVLPRTARMKHPAQPPRFCDVGAACPDPSCSSRCCFSPPPRPRRRPLTPFSLRPPNTAGITAYGGHVVLSRLDPRPACGRSCAGTPASSTCCPSRQRSVPFDADAGPDADGKPVVVYSRCATDPAAPGRGELSPAPDWQTARGCDVYELPLTGELREAKLAAPSSRTKSETTPSIWRGGVAFARHADGGATPTVLYVPAGAKAPRVLGGGTVPTCSSLCAAAAAPQRRPARHRAGARGVRLAHDRRRGVRHRHLLGAARRVAEGRRSRRCSTAASSAAPAAFACRARQRARQPDHLPRRGRRLRRHARRDFATVEPVTGARGSAPTPGGVAAGARA